MNGEVETMTKPFPRSFKVVFYEGDWKLVKIRAPFITRERSGRPRCLEKMLKPHPRGTAFYRGGLTLELTCFILMLVPFSRLLMLWFRCGGPGTRVIGMLGHVGVHGGAVYLFYGSVFKSL